MKNSRFYPSIWQTIPYSFEMVDHWKNKIDSPLELQLKNVEAHCNSVSEMTLSLTSIVIVDLNGVECQVQQFTKPADVTIRSMQSGYYIKTKESLGISKGHYKTVRFYIDRLGNSVTYANRNSEPLKTTDYLDFTIKDRLQIDTALNTTLVLKFDLEPLKSIGFFDAMLKFFSKSVIYADGLARIF